jgi:tripartite-type tricarboxylate transporter receptor subunit TctC
MRLTVAGTYWLLSISCALPVTAARAEPVDQFFKDRQVSLVVGFNPGGGYDLYARLVARHMGRHIPGAPTVVVRNMGGAGSLIAANYMAIRAATDGSEIGMIEGSIAIDPLVGALQTKFDSRKFYWLGSANSETGVCFIRSDARQKSFADMFAHELVTGTAGGSTVTWPTAMNAVLGTKFKLVSGYKGSNGVMLAFERNEVGAFCGNIFTPVRTARPQWLAPGGLAKVLVQMASAKHPELPDVPFLLDFAKTEEDRQVLFLIVSSRTLLGRSFFLPTGVPGERAAALRKAFAETMKDTQFLVEAKKLQMDVQPLGGAEIGNYFDRIAKTPQRIRDRAAPILARK